MNNLIGCRICLQVLDEPMECQECRSLFCSACISAYNATQRRPTCVMRCKVNFKPAHWSVKSLLNELQLTCNNTERGCTQILSYEQMKKHVKECDYGWVTCTAKSECPKEGLRSEMKVHDSLCGFVRLDCIHCTSKVKRQELQDHLENNCSKLPTQCFYCEQKFPKDGHQKHVEICRDESVDCRYCKTLIKRKEISEHFQKCEEFPLNCQAKCCTRKSARRNQ